MKKIKMVKLEKINKILNESGIEMKKEVIGVIEIPNVFSSSIKLMEGNYHNILKVKSNEKETNDIEIIDNYYKKTHKKTLKLSTTIINNDKIYKIIYNNRIK